MNSSSLQNFYSPLNGPYDHRYHLVWITKCRYQVVQGTLRGRVRGVVGQVTEELETKIFNGVVSRDHIYL